MPELETLRQDIDAVDDAIQDLLLRRAALVREVARSKEDADDGAATPLRPAREARILRRLAQRHGGDLPLGSIFRIWREIMSANLQLQHRFAVLLWQGEGGSALRDLARDFYGAAIPATAGGDARAIVEKTGAVPSLLGVLPMPDGGAAGRWWPHLADRQDGPAVIGCLPFFLPAAAPLQAPQALVVARAPFAPSGRDTSLFAWRFSAGDGAEAGIPAGLERKARLLDREGGQALLAVGGHCDGSEAFLAPLRERGELRPLGGYADPWLERSHGG